MSYKALLFDLDGTLLPLDQDRFIKEYFNLIVQYLSQNTEKAEKYGSAMKKAVFAMLNNDGRMSNEALFKKIFAAETGEATPPEEIFDEFYKKYFIKLKSVCGFTPEAKKTVDLAKRLGFRVVLATNPAFPIEATIERIRWAGLEETDFELITAYHNSRYCKPSLEYYLDIAEGLGLSPKECLMIGNDTLDDMSSEKVGMRTFLLTGCLVNRNALPVSSFTNGGWRELQDFILENSHGI